MATNEINLTLKITESGDLKLVGKKAEQPQQVLIKLENLHVMLIEI